MNNDAKFFERNPHRRYRVRPAARGEIEEWRRLNGGALDITPGGVIYSAVHLIAPGVRVRIPIQGPADSNPDSVDDESLARWIFETAMRNGATVH